MTLSSTAGQFHTVRQKRNGALSAAVIHPENSWHETRLTRSTERRSSSGSRFFSSIPSCFPDGVGKGRCGGGGWRGHCHCVPSPANSSLLSRQSHHRQHSWERGRAGTCSTPRLFRGLFRDSLLLHV